jgi:Gpi18-like mannosyltransferase
VVIFKKLIHDHFMLPLSQPLKHYSRAYNRAFQWIAATCIVLPLFFHFRHDYSTFTQQWDLILKGGNPWILNDGQFSGNAYGPLFNLFPYLYGIYSHLPHLIFICTWIGLSVYVLNFFTRETKITSPWMFAFFFLNPLFLVTIVSYGHFDIIPAALSVGCVVAYQKDKKMTAATFLACAVLFKFYPLILLPFLSVKQKDPLKPGTSFLKSIDWVFALGTLLILAAGFGIGYAIWGNTEFAPLFYAQDRGSTMLSIFRFFRSPWSPLGQNANIDAVAPIFLMATVGISGHLHLVYRRDSLLALITGFFCMLCFYRVGHPQFYTTLYFLVPFWIATQPGALKNKKLLIALFLPLLYVSLTQVIYISTKGFKFEWVWVDWVISIPLFAIYLYSLPVLWLTLKQSSRRETQVRKS